jgi:putative ABC transport system substrate-binding protein
MRRRRFLALAGGGLALATPRLAAAATARIAIVGLGQRQDNRVLVDAFRAGLAALGWVDGGNIAITERWAEGRAERLPAIIGELIGTGVDLLVTGGTLATLAATRAAAATPVVFVGVGDPLALGIVDTLDRPGGNTTGLSLNSPELTLKRLQLLQELVPGLHRIAVIIRNDPGLEQTQLEIHASATRMGLEPLQFEAATGKALEFAFIRLRSDRCQAVYVASGPLGPAKRAEIIALAAQARLPVVYSFREFTAGGGLVSLAADTADLFRRAAGFADQILKGAPPAALPVARPGKFDLAVNLKTAAALGLAVPQSILARADEVIE